ncbi:MAG: beta-N-acetylhexosaminidase, partial [Acidobacteria bacterium]|nr:beta-N-acetylhexosaminidase [Acidobacteriota bacterium]
MPRPQSVTPGQGVFTLTKSTKISAKDDASRAAAAFLNDFVQKNYGFKLKFASQPETRNTIIFSSAAATSDLAPDPSYNLTVERRAIRVVGSGAGQFYAVQSLIQLMPSDAKKRVTIPILQIADEPRFRYRGMHLDVGRHFMPAAFVKKYIDLAAQYKFNYFHWGLTQDQGWRVEIKKYPKLTEIGAWRKETVKDRNLTPYMGDNTPHGGFYTREEVKEILAYAKERYVTVIPEINVPGHSSAALAAYPQYGCKTNYDYKVQTTWGIFKDVYCPTEESFKFLEDVFGELIDLFPDSPYIHIGGDEVLKDHWKESPFVQELKQKENLKDENEVQSYFVRRIEKFVNSRGRKIIGWDEILEGGLAPNATVMS